MTVRPESYTPRYGELDGIPLVSPSARFPNPEVTHDDVAHNIFPVVRGGKHAVNRHSGSRGGLSRDCDVPVIDRHVPFDHPADLKHDDMRSFLIAGPLQAALAGRLQVRDLDDPSAPAAGGPGAEPFRAGKGRYVRSVLLGHENHGRQTDHDQNTRRLKEVATVFDRRPARKADNRLVLSIFFVKGGDGTVRSPL